MNRPAILPLDVVTKIIDEFVPFTPRDEKIVLALRDLIIKQTFDSCGKIVGPRLDIASISRQAGLSRNLISYEGCELQASRELILSVLKLLSQHSLQIECDYLREEVKRLQARLDRHDSILANRVVALHSAKGKLERTPSNKYSGADVRKSVSIVPMEEL